MNLHNIVSGAIGAVNPHIGGTLTQSLGMTKDASFKPVPSYGPPQAITAQVQPLTYRDLQQLDGINLGGKTKAMYINGTQNAVVRASQKGGDLVTLENGTQWLTVQILEDFSATAGWVKAAVTLQVQS